ncbi:MAG: hypothetical protein K0R10_2550 [Alphaproteobacteria bacterium]|nr:hypothetical protein [Alphaproteobacteria bacterium]
MTAEYSYFRAEGASLAAIDTIAEAKLEVEDMRWLLCQRYAASAVVGWLDSQTGRYTIHEFHFGIPSVAPEGWISTRPERQSEGAVERAMPVPGSADHFYITNFAGLIERAAGKPAHGKAPTRWPSRKWAMIFISASRTMQAAISRNSRRRMPCVFRTTIC